MNTRVTQADLHDTQHVRGLLAVLDSYASDPVGGGQPLRSDVLNRLPAMLRELPNARVLLAFVGDEIVGAAVCFFGLSTFRARPLVTLLPQYRGQGIGKALLAAAEEHARQRNCCKLTLEVQDDNARARALYQRFGFVDFVVGKPVPTRFLAKGLEP